MIQLPPDNKYDEDRLPSSLRTISWSQLEPWQRDNPAILTGYRRLTYSWAECFWTVWFWHNETVNIWTHVSGALGVLLALAATAWYTRPTIGERVIRAGLWAPFTPLYPFPTEGQPYVTMADWALILVFLAGGLICFTCSSVYHSSLCHSEKVVVLMTRLDFAGIFILGAVNFFPTFHYAFFCAPHLRNLYISMMVVSGITGIYISCSPTYMTPAYRRMRTYTYFACGSVAILPFVHAVLKNGWEESSASMSAGWIFAELLFYMVGALLYSERCPEYLAPGMFDLVGSSHQLFHCCSLLAVLCHWAAVGEGFRYWHGERGGLCY